MGRLVGTVARGGARPAEATPSVGRVARQLRAQLVALRVRASVLSRPEVASLLEELADLLDAGVSLPEAVSALHAATREARVRRVIEGIGRRLRHGLPLSQALAEEGFPLIVSRGVVAGEHSAELVAVLRELSEGLKQDLEMMRELRRATAYPAFVFLVIAAVAAILIWYVLPNVSGLLPAERRSTLSMVMIVGSEVVTVWWPAFVAALFGGAIAGRRFVRSGGLYRAPLVGEMLRQMLLARFFGQLALMLRTGMHLEHALEVVAEAMGNRAVRTRTLILAERLRRGVSMADALAEDAFFPRIATQLVAIGERTGHLDVQLGRMQQVAKRQAARRVQTVVGMLGPVSLVLVAGGLMSVFLGLLMPIYGSISGLGR